MNGTILDRVKCWIKQKESLRHFLCIFLWGQDLERDAEMDKNALVYDMIRYWEYKDDNTKEIDPELKAFGEQYEANMRKDQWIIVWRYGCCCLLSVISILVVLGFGMCMGRTF